MSSDWITCGNYLRAWQRLIDAAYHLNAIAGNAVSSKSTSLSIGAIPQVLEDTWEPLQPFLQHFIQEKRMHACTITSNQDHPSIASQLSRTASVFESRGGKKIGQRRYLQRQYLPVHKEKCINGQSVTITNSRSSPPWKSASRPAVFATKKKAGREEIKDPLLYSGLRV